MIAASTRLACLVALLALTSLAVAQPTSTLAPFAPAGSDHTPSNLSNARIMGICTVAVLVVAFFILYAVVATHKEKQKEIDLSKPLILTEEVGKKKKKKSKKDKKSDKKARSVDEEDLMPIGASEVSAKQVDELPPRVVAQTGPSLSSDPKSSSEEYEHSESSEGTENMSDSQRYRSAVPE